MNTIKIGWGRREISTNEPVEINGQAHLRISEGVHDPLYVTALCIDGGEGQDAVVFCSCDITSMRADFMEPLLERIAKMNPQIPLDGVIINATHTHTSGCLYKTAEKSPDGRPIYPGLKHKEFVLDMVAEAVCEAWDTRVEGGVAYGYGYAVVAHSRRTIYFDDVSARKANSVAPNGHGVMYGATNDPQFSHYEAGADHFLNAMFTFDANEKLTGVVVNVPCPSQTSELWTVLSSDYWNEVREGVAKEFGPDVYVLTQCAAAGDLSPRILHYKDAQARRMKLKYDVQYDADAPMRNYDKCMSERRDIAERILDGLRDIYSWASKEILSELPVRHQKRTLSLARRAITQEDLRWCEESLERMKQSIPDPAESTPEEYTKALSRYNYVKNRNNKVFTRYEALKTEPNLDTIVHTVQVGDIAFATNRFEMYMDYQHRIQARSPFIQTFVVQLAGDELGGYLATRRGMYNKGYSAAFVNSVGFEGGQQLVEGTLEMLNEMKNQNIQ